MFRYALLSMLAGCGWSERRFEAVGIQDLCDAASACAGTYDAATCVDLVRTTDRSGCAYDEKAAGDCMDALPDAACVDQDPFELKALAIPDRCYQAWDCDWLDLAAF
ncbi:MAG: hypothetical protein ABMB14_38655 [Myxococcota bacterium]